MDYRKYGFSEPMLRKRSELIAQGVDPYPYRFEASHTVADLICAAEAGEETGTLPELTVSVVGRLWARRDMGKTAFLDLRDLTGKVQLLVDRKRADGNFRALLSSLDLGDILGAVGTLCRTRTGELSIKIEQLQVLAKSVIPLPIGKEKGDATFFRVSDAERRYRERHVHWLLRDADRQRIETRSRIISLIRQHMEERGFLEVATPTVELVYGGAEARPFRTSIWALDHTEAFLRISPELYLKRYLVAGFEKVFTICQNFRNEGIDASHNPEFTMMEWYEAYTDYEDQMQRFENLVASVCVECSGSTKIRYQGVDLDFTPPWRRLSVVEALREFGGIDVESMSIDSLRLELDRHELDVPEPLSWGIAVAQLFEAHCEEQLLQPVFITDHPIEISPLTKVKRGDPRLVERFEPYAFRMELGNAYSELTDPVVQLARLQAQQRATGGLDYENHPVDEEFIRAIGCGMPPSGGVGLGIDRLIMLMTDAPTIRDVIPFPMVKPRSGAAKRRPADDASDY